TRTGIAGIAYSSVNTLTLNTSTGSDIVDIGTATLPAATPATVDVLGGAVDVSHLTINGNSGSGGSDIFNLAAFSAGTAASVNGGVGDDVFNVTASHGSGLTINGNSDGGGSGDALNYDAAGADISF